ncbi:MAG: GAF domain-containing sensor histidine kinase [Planctomycetes bacterium]|nr:GAF domain-containing sensor histidine kinase [Planctomycetota bacterium]
MGKRRIRKVDSARQAQQFHTRLRRIEQAEAKYKRDEAQRAAFVRLSRRLTTVASEMALMRVVCAETARLLGWDFCYLAHRPPEQDRVRIIRYVDTVKGRKRWFPGQELAPSEFSPPVRRVLEGRPLLINRRSVMSGPVMVTEGTKRRCLSLMYVPVRCADEVIGVLTVQSYERNRYGPADLRTLQQVADVLAPVLERVHAEDALRRAHRELEHRVKQRTAELQAANRRLQRETRERQRALDTVRRSEQSLRELTVEAGRRLESERARIARELHDGLGQVLTALNMNLAWMDKRLADNDASMKLRLAESLAYVAQMTDILRGLCKTLHPVVLDHHGLVEAIRSQVEEFKRYSHINCHLIVRPADLELPNPLALAAFRIVQEALTNVARHSGASGCWVSLRLEDGAVLISVRDDGIGGVAPRLAEGKSLGILGMKERATAVGGAFQIEEAGRHGTRVIARLPLKPPAAS